MENAAAVGNALPQVVVSEFDRGVTRLSTPRRRTLDENANEPALWKAASKSLLFPSDRGGAWKQGLEQGLLRSRRKART